VDFTSLPTSVQNADVAARFDALAMGAASEACGSPGEVANEPTEGHHFHIDGNGAIGDASRLTYWALDKYDGDMEVVHAHLAQHAPDQLRQRAAHALIQIFVISWEGDLMTSETLRTIASAVFALIRTVSCSLDDL
jgi:cullin-associated NEDD8-dissociated protein 1